MAIINTQTLAEILSKPSKNRLDFEIRYVCAWLREKVKYFRKLSDDILQTLVVECTVEKMAQNHVVIWEGDMGDCMYILLSGKLNVHRLNEPDKEDVVVDQPVELFPEKIKSQPVIEDTVILGQCLATLESGNIFGEVALIEKCMRTASVVTNEDCEVVVIPRDLYNNTVASVLEEEFKMKLEFIESVPFFSGCSQKHKKQLLMAIESHSCEYPTQIMKQGEPVTSMFFLMSGEIRLSCDPQHHFHHFKKIVGQWEQEAQFKMTGDFLQRKYEKQKKHFTLPKSFDVCLMNQTNQDLGSRPSVGDTELLLNLPHSIFTVTATSHCVVFVLHARHFERILVKKYPASILMMLELSLSRIDHWCSRIGDVLPLLTILKERTLYTFRNLQGYKGPVTLNQLVEKSQKQLYQYIPPSKGVIIDIFGPGTAFFYIRNKYNLQEKTKKYNLSKNFRQNVSSDIGKLSFQSSPHLRRPQQMLENRKEMFAKDVGYGVYYDSHTKELEYRIETFLKVLNSKRPTIVEPLSDVLEKIPKMKYPKRGNLVVLKPVNKPQKYLNNSTLTPEESVRLFLQQKLRNDKNNES